MYTVGLFVFMGVITFPRQYIMRPSLKRILNAMGMLSPLHGQMMPLGMASAVTPWYLAGGISLPQCVAAYQPKGAASLASSYVNLANPGMYDATPGVAPTLSSGWVFDGTTKYLTTGIVPTGNYSFIVQFSNVTSTGTLMGCFISTAKRMIVIPQKFDSSNNIRFAFGATASDSSPKMTSGNLALTPTAGYRNGVNSIPVSGATMDTYDIYIGADNINGAATEWCASTVIAVAIYNIPLTADQVLSVYTAMATL